MSETNFNPIIPANDPIPYIEQEDFSGLFNEHPRIEALAEIHQPVVIIIDTSGSMRLNNKAKIVKDQINAIKKIQLSDLDKQKIDICILVFDDEVRMLVDWVSLYTFCSMPDIEDFDCGGNTSLSDAILAGIDATKVMRYNYDKNGTLARRAQIFLYTDGASTQDMMPAIKRSREYFCRTKPSPSAKLNIIAIPPHNDVTELAQLGDKVLICKLNDIENGLPKSFKFLIDSIVAWSSLTPGKYARVTPDGGIQFVLGHGGVEVLKHEDHTQVQVVDWVETD